MGAVPRLVPDSGVSVGGCILRSADGELDARLDMQIEAMKAALVETRKRRVLGSSEAGEGARA
jgi:flagellar assembly protein FliH